MAEIISFPCSSGAVDLKISAELLYADDWIILARFTVGNETLHCMAEVNNESSGMDTGA